MKILVIVLVVMVQCWAHKETSPLDSSPKSPDLVGSIHKPKPILSLSKRETARQRCERCRNSHLCKNLNVCRTCNVLCEDADIAEATPVEDSNPNVSAANHYDDIVMATHEPQSEKDNIKSQKCDECRKSPICKNVPDCRMCRPICEDIEDNTQLNNTTALPTIAGRSSFQGDVVGEESHINEIKEDKNMETCEKCRKSLCKNAQKCRICRPVCGNIEPNNTEMVGRSRDEIGDEDNQENDSDEDLPKLTCDECRKSPICNHVAGCEFCRPFCGVFEITEVLPLEHHKNPVRGRSASSTDEALEALQKELQDEDALRLTSKLSELMQNDPNMTDRYYTVGVFKPGPSLNLVAKLLGINDRDNIGRFIVLAKSTKDAPVGQAGPAVDENKAEPSPMVYSKNATDSVDLADIFGKELDAAMAKKKKELKKNKLSRDETQSLIDQLWSEIEARYPQNLEAEADTIKQDGASNDTDVLGTEASQQQNRAVAEALKQDSVGIDTDVLQSDAKHQQNKTEVEPLKQDSATNDTDVGCSLDSFENTVPYVPLVPPLAPPPYMEPLKPMRTKPKILNPPVIQDSYLAQQNPKDVDNFDINDNEEAKLADNTSDNMITTNNPVKQTMLVGQAPQSETTPPTYTVNDAAQKPLESDNQYQSINDSGNLTNSSDPLDLKARMSEDAAPHVNQIGDLVKTIPNKIKQVPKMVKNMMHETTRLLENQGKLIGDNINRAADLSNEGQVLMEDPPRSAAALQDSNIHAVALPQTGSQFESTDLPSIRDQDEAVGQKHSADNLPNKFVYGEAKPFGEDERLTDINLDNVPKGSAYSDARSADLPFAPIFGDGTLNRAADPQELTQAKIVVNNTTHTINLQPQQNNTTTIYVNSKPEQLPGQDTNLGAPFTTDDYTNFGELVPEQKSPEMEYPDLRKVFFVGKNIKFPLQMKKNKDGVLQLTVDMEKLCRCKKENCTRKHLDQDEEMKNDVPNEYDQNPQLMLSEPTVNDGIAPQMPELQVRFGGENSEQPAAPLQTFRKRRSNAEKVDNTLGKTRDNDLTNEEFDELSKINDDRFKQLEEKLEDTLEKLDKDVRKYDADNTDLLNKGTVALFQNAKNGDDVKEVVDLVNSVLSWMKGLTIKRIIERFA